MDKRLLINALTKFLSGLLAVGLLLFLPAGTIHYWNAWLFIVVMFVPMLIAGLYFLISSPDLMAKRLRTDEREAPQKQVILLSCFLFVGGFLLCALDYRFGWSHLPRGVSLGASAVLLIGYGLYAEVMRENAFLSRTVELQEDQKVVDTGLYGIVRHPMYAATVLLFLSIPLVLGSVYGFLLFLLYPLLLVKRIKNEEELLTQGLPGYAEYKRKVRYRLLPYIW